MNYVTEFGILIERAIEQAISDALTAIKRSKLHGVSVEKMSEMLEHDFLEGGPIFGKFKRGVEGAAEAAILTASRQGAFLADVISDKNLLNIIDKTEREISILASEGFADDAEDLEEQLGDSMMYTSVAMLSNTCHICLPLHNKTMSLAEWKSRGEMPEDRHAGWNTPCKCSLIPSHKAIGIEPLYRQKIKDVPKGHKKTIRQISQKNIEKSQAAASKAMETSDGRKALRTAGQINKGV